ncbi:hypothetical protein [Pararobbsia alpina]|uniref:hypothetical protein n=1 Tax=Pararobbsia alpina TaxID=621374 RepID=UPI0015824361|nr:hypothetical protein [Pararobbsia alpina]
MEPASSPLIFLHLRVVIGIVVGLSITRLLSGLASFIQHPHSTRVFPTQLGWALTLLLMVVHFWWWEFRLAGISHWNFQLYFFVVFYAVLFFLLCALLFPDSTDDYSGYESYFFSRRRWFFGILALNFGADMVDTLVKGIEHFEALGLEYPIRTTMLILLCLIAMSVGNRRFHAAFMIFTFFYQLSWVVRDLDPIG